MHAVSIYPLKYQCFKVNVVQAAGDNKQSSLSENRTYTYYLHWNDAVLVATVTCSNILMYKYLYNAELYHTGTDIYLFVHSMSIFVNTKTNKNLVVVKIVFGLNRT